MESPNKEEQVGNGSPRASAMESANSPRSPRNADAEQRSRSRSRSPIKREPREDADEENAAEEDGERREENGEKKEGSNDKEQGASANDGTNLYVGNLLKKVTEEDLEKLFSQYGKVLKCEILREPISKESRGFGFVTMETESGADTAIEKITESPDSESHFGKTPKVEKARRKQGYQATPGQYLGPKGASRKYGRGPRGSRDRDGPRDRRSFDRRYDDRRYGDRYGDRRSRDRYDRRYDDRRYDDRRYDDRRYGDRRYDDRRYGDRRYDERRYGDRRYDDRRYSGDRRDDRRSSDRYGYPEPRYDDRRYADERAHPRAIASDRYAPYRR